MKYAFDYSIIWLYIVYFSIYIFSAFDFFCFFLIDYYSGNKNMSIEQISDNFINQCKRSTNYKFLGRRFGTLSNESKAEIFQLEMSMCLEKKYMKCLQFVNNNKKNHTETISSIDICEPLIREYIGTYWNLRFQ